jgi:hypothetical protein
MGSVTAQCPSIKLRAFSAVPFVNPPSVLIRKTNLRVPQRCGNEGVAGFRERGTELSAAEFLWRTPGWHKQFALQLAGCLAWLGGAR